MRQITFVVLVICCGAVAGLVYGGATLVLVEPYLDYAIEIENQNMFVTGAAEDTAEFRMAYEQYRTWQKAGMVLGSVILGIALGALFGMVFALVRGGIPGRGSLQKSLILAGAMWTILYLFAFFKYPPVPPAFGDSETLMMRTLLHLSFVAVLGFGAVGFYVIYKRVRRLPAAFFGGYAALAGALFVLMPESPDPAVLAPWVSDFRFASVWCSIAYWATLGVMLGPLWDRYVEPPRLRASN